MKILTNIRFAQTAGISQVLSSFIEFIGENPKNDIQLVGVNMTGEGKDSYKKIKKGQVEIVSIGLKKIPNIAKVTKRAKNLQDVTKSYARVISAFRQAIKKGGVDLVLVNGTYHMPWCLFLAAKLENKPVVLHYHGVLTKETEGWETKQRNLFKKMEKSFDKNDIFYIFPSAITKKVVEKEVFGHKIKKYAVLANPVPLHFFDKKSDNGTKNIGIVSRWTKIKNVEFISKLAEYDESQGGKFSINLITDADKESKSIKKLHKKIKVYKPCNNKKLADFYNRMDIVISPSHFETYGNVAKEAVASGTPAIISCNMGVKETFKKLGLGNWVINFNSVEKVYERIEKVIGNNINCRLRTKIKKLYSPDKIFNELLDILKLAKEC